MKILRRFFGTLLVSNLIVGFLGGIAEASSSSGAATVASGEESSALMTRISYNDLYDLFGSVDIVEGDESDLVGILQKNHDKIVPLLRKIQKAFGTANNNGATPLGFLEVTGLPPAMVALRQKLLPRASELANLPSSELEALEQPEMGYSIGWSHGKESFRVKDGDESDGTGEVQRRYDTAKGSFYMNPYADASIQNVYPPSLQPFLEADLLEMTQFMTKVGLWIAVLCDLYLNAAKNADSCSLKQECPSQDTVGQQSNDSDLDLEGSISSNYWMVYNSLKSGKPMAKARLLYYFPQKKDNEASINHSNRLVLDDWCGWHTDHGSLTALLPGMLTGEQDLPKDKQTSKMAEKPGLYIQTKMEESNADLSNDIRYVHVALAPDSLGFQLGETLEIMSRGKFLATPHAVKAPPSSSVGRASLALFLQPLANQVLSPLEGKSDSDDIFSLNSRWRSTFGEFQRVTIESFS